MDVTVNALPANITPAGTTTICAGNSVNISIAGSQTGVNYQLRNNADNSNIGSAVPGNGATISLPTGNLTATTVYNVLATITSTGCTAQMTVTPTVTVNPLPIVNAGAPQSICGGGSVTLNATGATTYSWTPSTGLSCTNSL